MKLKYSVFILLATVVAAFTACSDDEDTKEQAVGIVSGTITPMGSTVSYKLVPKDNATIENTNDSLAWDVTETALRHIPRQTVVGVFYRSVIFWHQLI